MMRFRLRVERPWRKTEGSLLRVWTARWSTGRFGGIGITICDRRVLFLEQTEP